MHLAAAHAKRKRDTPVSAGEPKVTKPRLLNQGPAPPVGTPASGLPMSISNGPSAGMGTARVDEKRPSSADLKVLMRKLVSPAAAAAALAGNQHGSRAPQQQQQANASRHSAGHPKAVESSHGGANSLHPADASSHGQAAVQPVGPRHMHPGADSSAAQDAAAQEGLSAANVAWQGGKKKQRRKLLSRMQPHATSDPVPAAALSQPAAPRGHAGSTGAPTNKLAGGDAAPVGDHSHLQPHRPHQSSTPEMAAGSDQLRQAVLKKHALGQLPFDHEPKVASSDSTDSVIAFPSRHLQSAEPLPENAPASDSLAGKPSDQWKPAESRGAAALSFLAAAGSTLQEAAKSKDAFWSGVSDADIAHAKGVAG